MGDEQNTYRISDLATTDRPRERLAEVGAQALNNDELLAILLRTGLPGENAVQMGQRLLQTLDGLPGLARASFAQISSQRGVGTAKAAQLLAAIELGRRINLLVDTDRPTVNNPVSAADLVKYEMSALDHEELWVLLLDTRNRLITIDRLYKGSLNASTVRVGEIFKSAIQRRAASILIVHNHPSGDPSPSPEDIHLTRSVLQAGKLLDIDVLDHLVIAGGRFVSLKDKKLGFE